MPGIVVGVGVNEQPQIFAHMRTRTNTGSIGVGVDEAVKELSLLGANGTWTSRDGVLQTVDSRATDEEIAEVAAIEELTSMVQEDFIVTWVNYTVEHSTGATLP
jgi:hypothetical protein